MHRENELEKLLEVSTLLSSTLELEPLLTQILKTSEELMDADASNIMLLDSATQELIYEVALGQAGSKIKEQKRLKVGIGIAGWVAQNKQSLLIQDAYSDPRFFRDFDLKTGFRTRSIICIPLEAHGKLIGIAQIINKKNMPFFSSSDQELFKKFGTIAAIAIDNALLHRQILAQDRLKRDLLLAEEIQKASLPTQIPSIDQLKVIFRSIPCRQVGGDLLEINLLPDGRLAILIGDVSGKGVPAALFGSKFSTEYQYELRKESKGGALLEQLNQLVAARSTRGMFITAIYAVFDPQSGKIEIVNSGHPEPLVIDSTGQVRSLPTQIFPPLGILENPGFSTSEFILQKDDQVIFMTDGVPEAKALNGTRLGNAQVKQALQQTPANGIARLMNTVNLFTHGEPPADDITVLGVRFGHYEEIDISSHPENLAKVRALTHKCAAKVGFEDRVQSRISLAVTEAVANITKHTYGMALDQPIRVNIQTTDNSLQIFIRDWGPKQDSRTFTSRDLADVRPGGLGIHYIKQIMSMVEFDHTHKEGNELFMFIKKTEIGLT